MVTKEHAATPSTLARNADGLDPRPAEARLSLAEEAYLRLKDSIFRNIYPPGFRATEAEVAGLLGMSRTPVREALLKLQSDGLIEITPRHGITILPIYAHDLREIYELLCSLESTAVELLCKRGLDPDAPLFIALHEINQNMASALESSDMLAWAELDGAFHRLMVENCGNSRITKVIFNIWDQQHRARMLAAPLRSIPAESIKEHRAVLEAIQRGDSRVAYEIHHAHRKRGMTAILKILEDNKFTHI